MAQTAEQIVAIEEAQFNIDQAQQFIVDSEAAIATAQENISEARADIDFATSQLTDPDLPNDRRAFYEANIDADLKVIASNEENIQAQQDSIFENNSIITQNQEVIDNVEAGITATDAPAAVDPETSGLLEQQAAINRAQLQQEEAIAYGPASVPSSQTGYPGVAYDDDGNLMPGYTLDEEGNPVYVGGDFVEPAVQASAAASRAEAAQAAATKLKAQQQATFQARYKQPGNADWRVRLVLGEGADYLYKDKESVDVLKPLVGSNGVIFPYTPKISTNYTANYDKYDLTHSNYRGYFYKNSNVGDINISATFTAQDTNEAQYLLAVIHFFRSVTKMFYGAKDNLRGSPPPLVYLVGYGDYQFSGHPCLVSNFQYELPSDVDYIRANNPNNYGTNLVTRRTPSVTSANPIASIANRLANAFLTPGALPISLGQGAVTGSVTNTNRSTYVPTKMEISITLLPVQTRAQVSQNFSLKNFANGNLLKGGYW